MKTKKPAQKKPIVWQVARRPSGAEFEDGSQQDVLLWVERASNRVRQMNLLPAGINTKTALKDSLTAALERPMPGCVAGCPGEIQVDDQPLLAELAELVQGMPIQLTLQRRLDSLDRFYQMLLESLEQGPGFAYLEGTRIHPSEVKALALATIEYLAARPFDDINGDDILRLDGLQVSPLYLSVLGMAGMEYGLGIYFNRETALAYLAGISDKEAASLPALSLTLISEDECPPLLDSEIRQNRWPCHPMGFPLLMRVDGDRAQPDSLEIRLTIDCLEAVRRFADSPQARDYLVGGRKVRVEWAQLSEPSPLAQLIFSNLESEPASTKRKSKSKR